MPPTEASRPSLAKIDAAGPAVDAPTADATTCANCGAALQGPYCAQCGQHVADYHRSLWRFLGEFFDNAICWDNKFLRTLGPLLTQPGVLTREFMAGRRVRYVQPLRLFLFVSAVCLALLQYHQSQAVKLRISPNGKGKRNPQADITFNSRPPATPAASAVPPVPTPDASGNDDDDDDKAIPGDAKAIAEKIRREAMAGKGVGSDFGDRIEKVVEDRVAAAGGEERFSREVANNVQQKLSWVTLAMLPLFALLLRMVYWRGENYYFAHLIFSLHYHTFLLLFWTLFTGWGVLVDSTFLLRWLSWFDFVLPLLPGVYLYVALRRVYGGSPRRTLVKVVMIGAVHLLALLIGVASVGALAVFMAGN